MAPARFAVFALLANVRLAGAIRLDSAALATSAETEVASEGRYKIREDQCTTETVQDAVRCGVDQIVERIEDGLKCGFDWCDVGPLYLCPKRCDQTVEVPATCEIEVSCTLAITLHIKAQTSTRSISGLHFGAVLENFVVTTESPELQEVLDGNKETILPWMQQMLDIGVPIANEMLHTETANFEAAIIAALNSDIVSKNAWIANLVLGGKGFQTGIQTAVAQRFTEIGALVHRRYEVQAAEHDQETGSLCARLLKVRTASGGENLFSDWSNALVARVSNLNTNCQTVYTAHCGTASLVATTKCPLEDVKVTKKCLFSKWCWAGSRTIKANDQEVITMSRGRDGSEGTTTEDITISHVADEATDGTVSGAFGGFHMRTQAVPAKVSSADNEDLAELNSLIQIGDDQLPMLMKDQVCAEVRKNAWPGTRAITEARCRFMFSTVYRFLDVSVSLPIGSSEVVADVSLRGGVFRLELIPDWQLLSEAASAAVKQQVDLVRLPLGAKLENTRIQFSGDNTTLYVQASPTLSGTLSKDEMDELRELLGQVF